MVEMIVYWWYYIYKAVIHILAITSAVMLYTVVSHHNTSNFFLRVIFSPRRCIESKMCCNFNFWWSGWRKLLRSLTKISIISSRTWKSRNVLIICNQCNLIIGSDRILQKRQKHMNYLVFCGLPVKQCDLLGYLVYHINTNVKYKITIITHIPSFHLSFSCFITLFLYHFAYKTG